MTHTKLYAAVACLLFVVTACVADPPPDPSTSQQPVINGSPSGDGDYPAAGALLVGDSSSGYYFYCSGTLIRPNVVLTAAHCVDPMFIGSDLPSFTLTLDANSVSAAEVVGGTAAIPHPNFDINVDPATGVQVWYDIGLVFLDTPVTSVTPAIIATPTEAASLAVGTQVELVGYGLTTVDGDTAGVKYQGVGDVVDIGTSEVQISMPGQQQNCYGDSGGPGFVDLGAGRRLLGVVSRGPDPQHSACDLGGIDTRADAYLEWINNTIAEQIDPPDAGVTPDAMPTPDADVTPDAGLDAGNPADGDGGGGCGCRTGSSPEGGAVLLLLVAAVVLRRRRA